MLIILVGFTILGVMIVFFIMQYWKTDRWDGLKSNATTISLAVTDNADYSSGKLTFTQKAEEVISVTMRTLSNGLHSDIIVTDSEGNQLISAAVTLTVTAGE